MEKTDSLTNLLKLSNVAISTVKANKILVALGLLAEKERPSSKYAGKMKKYKALSEQGLRYGINVENPSSPGQTTPHYFSDTFVELLALIQREIKRGPA
ncbi:MAG: hypothetical protein ACYC2W_09070 [Desulfurivibrionaceae bacterium]